MPSVRYTGTAEVFETTITGRPQKWAPGQIQDVTLDIAVTLLASGLGFESYGDLVLPFAFDANGNVIGVRVRGGGIASLSAAAASAGNLTSQTISAAGLGASFSVAAVTDNARLTFTFGNPTGSVTSAIIQVENAADNSVIGSVIYPGGSGRGLPKPAGATSIQLRTLGFAGTGSLPVSVGY